MLGIPYKIPIFINGLLPNNRDSREFKNGTWSGGSLVFVKIEKAGLELLKEALTADSNGRVQFMVPDDYAGGSILTRIRHRWYKPISAQDSIPDYGYFYTAKIVHDFTNWSDSPSSDPEWKTEEEYIRASAEKNNRLRNYRYKNTFIRFLYYAILITAPMAGFLIGGLWGVVFGFFVAGFLELLAPYSIGLKKFWRPGRGGLTNGSN
jgi:hypothetical protein